MPTRPSRRGRAARKGAGRNLTTVDIPIVSDASLDEIRDTMSSEAVVLVLRRLLNIPG